MLSIALPKGRLGEKVYDIFERAGKGCPSIKEKNRKLIFEGEDVSYFWAKPSDVSVYVERGAADIGIAGSDILVESNCDVYELLDLGIGKCRMAVAAKNGFRYNPDKILKVATKFPHTASDYYRGRNMDVEIIKLNGSIELAPILGMSDVIVDIVETGATLRENGLSCIEDVSYISARLIANKVSYKFKNDEINRLKAAVISVLGEIK
ncbi:MAG: ATP phosphoribosyltransferase [Christensenellaceae bacterium]|nr:ATP phosphoribosyltransferase [Christensenellaceae bacterium]